MSINYLLTGATGFLGKTLQEVLSSEGEIHSLGRSPSNQITCDLSKEVPKLAHNYTTVIHNAGKAHMVPKTAQEKQAFFQVNVEGTKHLLTALENCSSLPKAFIFISSVAVYGAEVGQLIAEDNPLDATDPYGKSKILAEETVTAWGKAHGVTVGILRLPLVAGPLPPGNLHKMLKAQKAGYYFQIGQGSAKRSVVVAKDIAQIVPKLAEIGGIYNLTDGYHPSFQELGKLFAQKLEVKSPHIMPPWLAKTLAMVGEITGNTLKKDLPFNERTLSKMTSSLTFSDEKAVKTLGWNPEPVLSYLNSLSKKELIND